VYVTLVDAGHILGSAGVVLDIEEQGSALSVEALVVLGDIGRRKLPLLRDPVLPASRLDVMECTYGTSRTATPQVQWTRLREVVNRTLKRGGKVIIPAFAVGRTQDLIYDLHILMDGRQIPQVPVIVDSPLAVNASDIYRRTRMLRR